MADINRTQAGVEIRKYRVNPVEVVILAMVGAVFLNSIYNLFYDSNGFHPAALKSMAANPVSEGRSPASISSNFQSVDVSCAGNPELSTGAAKVRLSGPLCAGEAANSPDPLTHATVFNETNKFNATVFTDGVSNKFSTDYIPLSAGKNQLKVEFSYRSGKVVTQELAFSKF